jgi:hypothetical protein
MLLPPQLEASKDVDCGSNTGDIITNDEKKNFTIRDPEPGNGNKKIFFRNRQVRIILVAQEQDRKVAEKIQELLRNAGFIIDITSPQEAEKIKDKSSMIYFSPIIAATPDVYNLFGKKSSNLVLASSNNELTGLEDLLLDYRNTKFSDESKRKLADFMIDNFITMTLVQGKEEYNYSPRIFGMKENLPDFTTMTQDVYYQIPRWYIDREVKSKIFG